MDKKNDASEDQLENSEPSARKRTLERKKKSDKSEKTSSASSPILPISTNEKKTPRKTTKT